MRRTHSESTLRTIGLSIVLLMPLAGCTSSYRLRVLQKDTVEHQPPCFLGYYATNWMPAESFGHVGWSSCQQPGCRAAGACQCDAQEIVTDQFPVPVDPQHPVASPSEMPAAIPTDAPVDVSAETPVERSSDRPNEETVGEAPMAWPEFSTWDISSGRQSARTAAPASGQPAIERPANLFSGDALAAGSLLLPAASALPLNSASQASIKSTGREAPDNQMPLPEEVAESQQQSAGSESVGVPPKPPAFVRLPRPSKSEQIAAPETTNDDPARSPQAFFVGGRLWQDKNDLSVKTPIKLINHGSGVIQNPFMFGGGSYRSQ